jgi:hypothetical protein
MTLGSAYHRFVAAGARPEERDACLVVLGFARARGSLLAVYDAVETQGLDLLQSRVVSRCPHRGGGQDETQGDDPRLEEPGRDIR